MENPSSIKKSKHTWLSLFFCGICMGVADIIPGVSGGTIAFVMGFYQDLIESLKTFNLSSIKSFAQGNFQAIAWKFLGSLGLGVVVAFMCFIHFFNYLLSDPLYSQYLYATFTGLILASAWLFVKKIPAWNTKHALLLLLGVFLSFLLTNAETFFSGRESLYSVPYVYHDHAPILNYDRESSLLKDVPEASLVAMIARQQLSKDAYVFHQQKQQWMPLSAMALKERSWLDFWLIFCGAVAVSAMLLPGISGSYLLTVMGAYPAIIAALADFLKSISQLNWDGPSFYILGNLGIGILFGAIFFARFVSWLFKSYQTETISLLVGFMLGAMPTIWPFWEKALVLNPNKLEKGVYLKQIQPILYSIPLQEAVFAFIFGLIGFMSIRYIEHKAALTKKPSLFSE